MIFSDSGKNERWWDREQEEEWAFATICSFFSLCSFIPQYPRCRRTASSPDSLEIEPIIAEVSALGREKHTNMLWKYCRLRGWEEETSRPHSENWRPLVKWLDGRCLVKAGILIWLKYQDVRCQLELSVRQEPLFGSNP